jgi:drug/metabolite transporter (DMT)-like permease
MPERQDDIGGIIAIMAAMTCFIFSDVFTKLATQSLPVGQVLALRGMLSVALFAVPVLLQGSWRMIGTHASRWWGLRLAGEAGCALAFVSALPHLPIANLTAILQTAPLALTAVGALVLGEIVGARRWLATIAGFGGMLLIVKPGAGDFSIWSLLAITAMAFVVLRDLSTRFMDKTIPATLVTMTSAAGVALSGVALGVTEGPWQMPGLREWLILSAGAIAVASAYFFSIQAVRKAELATIAPFRYVILPLALLAGWLVWRDVPDLSSLAGIAIIASAGITSFLHARKAKLPAARAT